MHPETPTPPTPEPEAESTSRLGRHLKRLREQADLLSHEDKLEAIYVNTLPREPKGPSVGQRVMEQLAEISEAQVESLMRLDRLLSQVDTLLALLQNPNAVPVSAPAPTTTPSDPSVAAETADSPVSAVPPLP